MNKDLKFYGILSIKLNDLLENNKEESDYKDLINKLVDIVSKFYFDYKARMFILDCQLGVSLWCGEIILNFLENYKRDILFYRVIPKENMEKDWNIKYQIRYKNLVEYPNLKVYTSHYFNENIFEETEKFIIQQANIIFAVCDFQDIFRLNQLLDIVFIENKGLILLDINTLNVVTFY